MLSLAQLAMIRALLSALTLLLALAAQASTPPAIDTNANATKSSNGSGASLTCGAISTDSTNDVIVFVGHGTTFDGSIKTGISVVGGSLTFAQAGRVTRVQSGVWGSTSELWWAKAASTLSAMTFTMTWSGSMAQSQASCFAIAGTHFAAPLDGNASLAATVNNTVGTTQITVAGVTTTFNDDMIVTVCGTGFVGAVCTSAASGYTSINGGGDSDSSVRTYYKTITTALSAASVDIDSTPSGGATGLVQAFTADSPPGGMMPHAPW